MNFLSEERPFFWVDMAGLGKYSMGRYGRIGVHRVNFRLIMGHDTNNSILQ